MFGDERFAFETENCCGKRVFVKSDGAGGIVKMFVAEMTKSFKTGRFRVQITSAFATQGFRPGKDLRFCPALFAGGTVGKIFDAAAANLTRLRVSEGQQRVVNFVKHLSLKVKKGKGGKRVKVINFSTTCSFTFLLLPLFTFFIILHQAFPVPVTLDNSDSNAPREQRLGVSG